MLDCSLIKYSLKLINEHIRHVVYLQFTINVFEIYPSISVSEVIFTMIYKIFVNLYITIYLGAHFLVYLVHVLMR